MHQRTSVIESHLEGRRLLESSVNYLPGLWASKVHAFLQWAEVLFIRCDRAADVPRNTQVPLRLLHGLCRIYIKIENVLYFPCCDRSIQM